MKIMDFISYDSINNSFQLDYEFIFYKKKHFKL